MIGFRRTRPPRSRPAPPRSVVGLLVVGCMAVACAADVPDVEVSPTPTPSAPVVAPTPQGADATANVGTTRIFDVVPPIHPSVDGYAHGEVVLTAPDGARWELPVLVARSGAETQHGLMEVTALPDGTGMAFLFEEDKTNGFWMFGTHIDIDIVYVTEAGTPVKTFTMVPCVETPCPSYPPGGAYRNVLEAPGGWFERIGFGLDWTVDFVAE